MYRCYEALMSCLGTFFCIKHVLGRTFKHLDVATDRTTVFHVLLECHYDGHGLVKIGRIPSPTDW